MIQLLTMAFHLLALVAPEAKDDLTTSVVVTYGHQE